MNTNIERLPMSVRVIAWIFIGTGIFQVCSDIWSMLHGEINLNPAWACIPIGAGLLHRKNSARKWAIAALSLPLVISAILLVMLVMKRDAVKIADRPWSTISTFSQVRAVAELLAINAVAVAGIICLCSPQNAAHFKQVKSGSEPTRS